MDFQKIKLVKENFVNEDEKQDWEGGVFVGKEKSNFYINLPDGYEYNQDIRLQGTNSFYYKNENFAFTIIGEEVQKSLHLYQNEQDNFENSIHEYMDKVFSYLKSNGIENPKNLKLYKIETDEVYTEILRTLKEFKDA